MSSSNTDTGIENIGLHNDMDVAIGLELDCSSLGCSVTSSLVAMNVIAVSDAWDGVTGSNKLKKIGNQMNFETPNQALLDKIVGGSESGIELIGESVEPPRVGKVFCTWEEIEVEYRKYAKQQGFGILRAAAAIRGRKSERRNVTWKCECSGKPDTRRRSKRKMIERHEALEECPPKDATPIIIDEGQTRKSKKCECKAMLYASVNTDKSWTIRKVVLAHTNHNPTPSKSKHIHQHRKENLNNNVRRKLELHMNAGLSVPQFCDKMALECHGVENMPITERYVRNELQKKRTLKLQDGDANAMIKYFQKMYEDNQQFFHSCRLEEDRTMKDVLWVDARSRAAYEEYGDVVGLDATYLTNEYQLPFANFVGVNHHGQSVLLGCALISHETTETYQWVFETWLLCMGGNSPNAILTDQAASMRKAISTVLPQTIHRWCLWHILQKFPGKLGAHLRYNEFYNPLLDIVYDSISSDEFNSRWSSLISKYDLCDNEWLKHMFNERAMWVPAYCTDYIWAGMKTTQRVESINSFFR